MKLRNDGANIDDYFDIRKFFLEKMSNRGKKKIKCQINCFFQIIIPPQSSEQFAEIHCQEVGGIDAAIANNQRRLRVEFLLE